MSLSYHLITRDDRLETVAKDLVHILKNEPTTPKKMTDLDILANLAIMFTTIMEVPSCPR